VAGTWIARHATRSEQEWEKMVNALS